jgi:hypothetical protein
VITNDQIHRVDHHEFLEAGIAWIQSELSGRLSLSKISGIAILIHKNGRELLTYQVYIAFFKMFETAPTVAHGIFHRMLFNVWIWADLTFDCVIKHCLLVILWTRHLHDSRTFRSFLMQVVLLLHPSNREFPDLTESVTTFDTSDMSSFVAVTYAMKKNHPEVILSILISMASINPSCFDSECVIALIGLTRVPTRAIFIAIHRLIVAARRDTQRNKISHCGPLRNQRL